MTQEKFSRQVMAMQPTLYRLSCSLLRCEADREDAVQSAIEKAWRNRFFLRRAEGFRPWLTRILVNECYTLMRKSARMLPAESLPENATPYQAAHLPIPDDAEDALALEQLFSALPEEERLALMLRYVEGYDIRQIARITHSPEGTVKGRLHRGREHLRTQIAVKELMDE